MSTATTRLAEPTKAVLRKREELSLELIALHKKLAKPFADMEQLEIKLKALATSDGNFKFEQAGKGSVSVSAPKESAFKGNVPIVVTEAWLGLTDKQRKKFEDDGLVKVEAQYSQKYYGRVTVKVAA